MYGGVPFDSDEMISVERKGEGRESRGTRFENL